MKLKLDQDWMTDDFFEGTRLIGIVASMKDYQLCWHLNQLLNFDFRNNTEIEIQLKKKTRSYYFNVFQYNEPNSSLGHYLYNNQFDGEYLLPEFKHLDFLWLLKGDYVSNKQLAYYMESLKNLAGIQLVTELTIEKIRHKGHLIF
jgi:hypothetical protein